MVTKKANYQHKTNAEKPKYVGLEINSFVIYLNHTIFSIAGGQQAKLHPNTKSSKPNKNVKNIMWFCYYKKYIMMQKKKTPKNPKHFTCSQHYNNISILTGLCSLTATALKQTRTNSRGGNKQLLLYILISAR